MKQITLGDQSEWQSKNLEHLRYEYDLKRGDTVVDIGAYKGEFSEKIFNKYECDIIAFEPTEVINELKIPFPYTICQAAAWIFNGKITLGGEHNWVGQWETDHVREYPCVDIAQALENISEIALCKINIEGSEYDLLTYMIEKGMMKKIKYLQVQFHYVAGRDSEKEYREIAEKLALTHKLSWRYPFVWESWEKI